MKPCPYCDSQIQDAAIKCRFCGMMLTQEALAKVPPTRQQRPSTRGAPILGSNGDGLSPEQRVPAPTSIMIPDAGGGTGIEGHLSCPKCGKPINAEARSCGYCWTRLEPRAGARNKNLPKSTAETKPASLSPLPLPTETIPIQATSDLHQPSDAKAGSISQGHLAKSAVVGLMAIAAITIGMVVAIGNGDSKPTKIPATPENNGCKRYDVCLSSCMRRIGSIPDIAEVKRCESTCARVPGAEPYKNERLYKCAADICFSGGYKSKKMLDCLRDRCRSELADCQYDPEDL